MSAPHALLAAQIDRLLKRRAALLDQAGVDFAAWRASRPERLGMLLEAGELYALNGFSKAAQHVLDGLKPFIVEVDHPDLLERASRLESHLSAQTNIGATS